MLLAVSSDQITVATIVAVVTITAGAVSALLGLRGETRESIESEADKKIAEAREHENQLINVGREWREQWQAVEELRAKQEDRHTDEVRGLRDRIDTLNSDLAVAQSATDISGLETRMNERFDLQTKVLADLVAIVGKIAERLDHTPPKGATP